MGLADSKIPPRAGTTVLSSLHYPWNPRKGGLHPSWAAVHT